MLISVCKTRLYASQFSCGGTTRFLDLNLLLQSRNTEEKNSQLSKQIFHKDKQGEKIPRLLNSGNNSVPT